VENVYVAYNFSHCGVYLTKFMKIGKMQFFSETRGVPVLAVSKYNLINIIILIYIM